MSNSSWLEGATFGMTNSYWMVIGTVAAIGAVSQVAKGGVPAMPSMPRFGGGNVDAQEYWNNLSAEQAQSLFQTANRF